MPDETGAVGTDTPAEAGDLDFDSAFAEVQSELDGTPAPNTEVEDEVEAPSEGQNDPGEQPTEGERYKVTVDGQEIEVTLDEALKGYQRQSDYTRKTQQLAADRERFAAFERLDRAFSEDPAGTLNALAQSLGVTLGNQVESEADNGLDPDDPVSRQVAELNQKLQRFEEREAAREAAEREAAVDREVEAVKVQFNAPDLDVDALLEFAVKAQIPSLEIAYKAMNYEKAKTKETPPTLDKKRNAPPVEGGRNRNVGVVKGSSDRPSFDEAWDLAWSESN